MIIILQNRCYFKNSFIWDIQNKVYLKALKNGYYQANKPKMAYSHDAFTRDYLERRERLERN